MRSWKLWAAVLVFLSLVACSQQPKPEDTFTAYMDAWENGKYDKMYGLLSESSQGLMTEEEFVDRYETIYDGISMEDLAVTYDLPEESEDYGEGEEPSFDFGVKMGSIGGEIDFTHAASLVFEEGEEERWAIDWDSSMIFPGMKEGYTVYADSLSSERGEIFDADGQGLAVNGEVQRVGLVPEQIEEGQEEALKEGLSEELGMTVEAIDAKLDQSWVEPSSFVPIGAVAADDEAKIEALKKLPKGFIFKAEGARVYPLKEAAAHLTGYVGAITAEQLEDRKGEGYSSTSRIGQAGLEAVFEDRLRGTPGGKVAIRDEKGNEEEVLAETEPVAGEDVTLTISSDVQKNVYNQMKDDSGSASAVNPTTGEVLAMVSAPAYDPNQFILGMGAEERQKLQEAPGSPLLNKFTRTYSPGSTFKPITAAIGLETGAIDPAEELSIPDRTYTQDGWGGYSVTRVPGAAVDTQVNLRDALVRSDNIYFARSILEIGGEAFLKGAEPFGFGEDIPFPYPVESSQILNADAFKEQEPLLADTGYGQGQVQMSTLHLAMTYTPFITDGTLLKPTLIKDEGAGEPWHENVLSEETAATIKEDLRAVVADEEGTAHKPVTEGLSLAGKTGTAELKQSLEDENGQENGWFVAWDTESWDLLVSMMIEDVDKGSAEVVPKVKKVFEQSS
ncbi:penicillin-binding transpeptidase domain-containing protein [Halobacillus sp. BAB-2008]|uniref:penicillin-binding transpeptidase domain-containing protein n=1 Tax=Halobacillus sp. BAB-2008 TaxID=1246484 RepID=UPI0002A510F5|nr:penicillin-binding transpeptidase domain-containing protein [Halobacillus sp. BAB-2008]ELK46612.1 penicillin-binding protein 3 [Halobacillus sp. BAB-2008]